MDSKIENFLTNYDEQIVKNVIKLRELLFANLPDIIEQLDLPARMIGYCYGQKYSELICVIIPSKKGLKLGFNRGTELPDPEGLLEGTGKISRYIEIHSEKQIQSPAIKKMLYNALMAYKLQMTIIKK